MNIELVAIVVTLVIGITTALFQFISGIITATKTAYATLLEIKAEIKDLSEVDKRIYCDIEQIKNDNNKSSNELRILKEKINRLDIEIIEIFRKLKMRRRGE